MIVDIEDFKRVINDTTNIGINDNLLSSKIFKWYSKHPNQKERYEIKGSLVDKSTSDTYAKYGIDMNVSEYGILPEREYVLILEDVDPINIQKDIENFCNTYLPEGEVPSWYVVRNKKYTNLQQLREDAELIDSVVEGCRQLLDYPALRNAEYVEQALNVLKEPYKKLGVENFIDIKDIIETLDNVVMKNNYNTPKVFNETMEKIIAEYKKNPRSVLTYSGFNSDLYMCIAATLKYFYGIECIIPTELTQTYLSRYSSLVFDRHSMLVEDQIEYLKRFPTLSFVKNDYEFMIFIATARTGNVKLKFCPLDSIDKMNVTSIELGLHEVNIIRLADMFNLESGQEIVIREEHKKLLDYITRFEDCILPDKVILNLTNTFFMELEGTAGVAYVEHMDFNAKGIGVPFSKISEPQSYETNLDKINMLIPLTMLADWKLYANMLSPQIRKLGLTELVHPPKHTYRNALLYKWFAFNGSNLMTGLQYNDFVTIGLYWKETIVHRTRLIRKLQANLGRSLLRSGYTFVSAFGGIHPLIDGKTLVSSTNFRRSDIDV